jgi:type I restriction enzyme S subunit
MRDRIPIAAIGDSSIQVSDGNYSSKYPKSHEFLPKGIPFVSANNLRDGRIVWDNMKFISEDLHASLKKGHVRAGDVLLVTRGSLGLTALVTKEFHDSNINAQLVLLRADNQTIDARYLFFVTNSPDFQSQVVSNATGTAQPQLPIGPLKRLTIPLPPLDVQRRIAGILSAYDELMENNQRRIRILQAMARALYREWFVHFRFPGHERHPRVASSLGKIPKRWEVKKLGDVLKLNYGKALKKEDRRDGPFPVYGSSGMVGTHDAGLVEGPGMIVGRKGNVGSVFWCDDDFFVIDTAYFVTSSLPLRFLFYVLPTLNFINSDAAVPGLSRNQAYALEILVPPAALLAKFCELADTFERQAATLQHQINNLRQTRDVLLPRLLSGQIDLAIN